MLTLLAAVLTIAALMLIVRLPSMGNSEQESITVQERDGIYNLTDIGDLDKTAVILPPGKAYYPNVLLTPENEETAVPESTDYYDALRADYLSQPLWSKCRIPIRFIR